MITADTTIVTADSTSVLASGWSGSFTGRACIAFENLADKAGLTASSAAPLTPVSRLQNTHVARKWRGTTGNAQFVVADFASPVAIDTIAVMGLNLSAGGRVRVRISSADPSGAAGDRYDSGEIAGAVDPAYGMFVHLIPVPVGGRYVRIDLDAAGPAYVEAGRLFLGRRYQFATNFTFGHSRAWVDTSRRTRGRGGQTFIDPGAMYRTVDLAFDAVRESERFGFVECLDRINGAHADVLFVPFPASTNLGRDSIWGLIDEVSPVLHPAGWIGGKPIYSKTFKISERL